MLCYSCKGNSLHRCKQTLWTLGRLKENSKLLILPLLHLLSLPPPKHNTICALTLETVVSFDKMQMSWELSTHGSPGPPLTPFLNSRCGPSQVGAEPLCWRGLPLQLAVSEDVPLSINVGGNSASSMVSMVTLCP